MNNTIACSFKSTFPPKSKMTESEKDKDLEVLLKY